MTEKPPVVIIVDDDASFRTFLARLVGTVGLQAVPFASAEEFLSAAPPDSPACLVLDVQMPGLSGPGSFLRPSDCAAWRYMRFGNVGPSSEE